MIAKGNNVKVKPDPPERVLKSGIILPDTSKQRGLTWGTVEQSNDYIVGSKGEKLDVGARVLFAGESKSIIKNRQILYWEC